MTDTVLEGAAHVVQLALTPVFLLSGVAALVNVFSTRLGRVSDQADKLSEQRKDTPGHDLRLELLRWRPRALDFAVVLAALAGASACGAALALFLGAGRGSAGASLLFWLFGSAIVLTVAALAFFVNHRVGSLFRSSGGFGSVISALPDQTELPRTIQLGQHHSNKQPCKNDIHYIRLM